MDWAVPFDPRRACETKPITWISTFYTTLQEIQ